MSGKEDLKRSKKEEKKKAVEEALEEEELSDSEEEETSKEGDKSGLVELAKKKDKFKTVFAILRGGSLFYYKEARDAKPAAPGLALKKLKLNKSPAGIKKDFCFSLEGDKESVYFALYSDADFKEWVTAIEKGSTKDESEAPDRGEMEKKKKEGILSRTKKNIAGSAAASVLGKKVIKSILNEETSALLVAVKKIVTKESGKKKADEVERNIIKITVKAYLLVDKKEIEGDAFLGADKPLRQAFEILIKCFNRRGHAKTEQIRGALEKAEVFFKNAEKVITGLLQPHLSGKNMFRLAATFSHLGSASFLEKAFADQTMEEELEKLIDAMEYYTQFHYN